MNTSRALWAAMLTVCMWGLLQASANARTLFTFGSSEPDSIAEGQTINIGNDFTVGATPMYVTNIGAYVGPDDQLGGKTTVTFEANLYSFNDTPISSTLIPIGTPVDSQGFAYVAYRGTLLPGNAYVLTDVATDPTGATAVAATPFAYNGTNGPAGTFDDASFNFNIFQFNPSPPNIPPGQTNGAIQEFLGGNLQFSTPEPSSLVGLIGLVQSACCW